MWASSLSCREGGTDLHLSASSLGTLCTFLAHHTLMVCLCILILSAFLQGCVETRSFIPSVSIGRPPCVAVMCSGTYRQGRKSRSSYFPGVSIQGGGGAVRTNKKQIQVNVKDARKW